MRSRRVRAKVAGTAKCPRAAIFRSLRHISVQLIDDQKGHTVVSLGDTAIKAGAKMNKVATAKALGQAVAKAALEAKITSVVFDRRGYRYHGRVMAIAEGMREGGLKF